jgi:hypothetical protein
MNKLAFALATIATLGLSTAVFAQASTTAPPQRVQSQSQTHATHHIKKPHHVGVNKVVVRHDRGLHRGFVHSRHYGYHKNKKVVIKHAPSNRTVKTKASS